MNEKLPIQSAVKPISFSTVLFLAEFFGSFLCDDGGDIPVLTRGQRSH